MNEAVLQRLKRLDSCALSDALDSLELPAAVVGLQPLSSKRRIAGFAVTVQLGPTPPAGGSTQHLGTEAIANAGASDVIVIAHHPAAECAGWGGVLSVGAQQAGICGVVLDGPARDIDEATDLDFPIFATGPIARTARGRIWEQSTNQPVQFAGVPVNPGDLVLADASGVVIIPAGRADEVIERAEKIMKREQLMVAAIRRGDRITDVVGRDYEDMLKSL